jgi:hypothetical protein
VRVLSRVFRGKLLDRFDRALQTRTSGVGAPLGHRLIRQAASKKWVVYSKAPMAGPEQVLRYLGRYTHRIAIGNERLVVLREGKVTFRYRDRSQGNATRLMTLEARDFIGRFLVHVLPRGFVRVRHYGFQANGQRHQMIARARQLLADPAPLPAKPIREPWPELFRRLTGRDPLQCPFCKEGRLNIVSLPKPRHRSSRGP